MTDTAGREIQDGSISSDDEREWSVVCYDNLHPHEMTFPVEMQAQALAATMTRHKTVCPICGCCDWIAIDDVAKAVEARKLGGFSQSM